METPQAIELILPNLVESVESEAKRFGEKIANPADSWDPNAEQIYRRLATRLDKTSIAALENVISECLALITYHTLMVLEGRSPAAREGTFSFVAVEYDEETEAMTNLGPVGENLAEQFLAVFEAATGAVLPPARLAPPPTWTIAPE
jgi:hypothetical protein